MSDEGEGHRGSKDGRTEDDERGRDRCLDDVAAWEEEWHAIDDMECLAEQQGGDDLSRMMLHCAHHVAPTDRNHCLYGDVLGTSILSVNHELVCERRIIKKKVSRRARTHSHHNACDRSVFPQEKYLVARTCTKFSPLVSRAFLATTKVT